MKLSVKSINEQYKIVKFNIILKIYTFHLTNVMIKSERVVKLFFLIIHLVNKVNYVNIYIFFTKKKD